MIVVAVVAGCVLGPPIVNNARADRDAAAAERAYAQAEVERAKGERLSDLRIEEALSTGANIIATSCPYCIAMLDDSIRTMNAEDKIKLKDVTELFYESLEG